MSMDDIVYAMSRARATPSNASPSSANAQRVSANEKTRVVFRTRFWTNWGEHVVACVLTHANSNSTSSSPNKSETNGKSTTEEHSRRFDPSKGVKMTCAHVGEKELEWRGECALELTQKGTVMYRCVRERAFRANERGRMKATMTIELVSVSVFDERLTVARFLIRRRFRYAVVDEHGSVVAWDGEVRGISREASTRSGGVECVDVWSTREHPEHVFERKGFAAVVAPMKEYEKNGRGWELSEEIMPDWARECDAKHVVKARFEVRAPRATGERRVHVRGSCAALGAGDRALSLKMGRKAYSDVWWIEFEVDAKEMPFEYAYMISGIEGESTVDEDGGARECSCTMQNELLDSVSIETSLIKHDGIFLYANVWQGAGMALPVFAARTQQSVGCGDFMDLQHMVDFASATGMSVVQVLPVNDTCVHGMWWDSYPYSSLSVHALHVMYLRPQLLTGLTQELKDEIEAARVALDLKQIDYDATVKVKLAIARKSYENDASVLEREGFLAYFEENKNWLKPYAVFCVLRDLFGTAEHWRWGVFSRFSEEILEKIAGKSSALHKSVRFFYYLQYHLHAQLFAVSEYAKRAGIVLKGDLPVGVDKCSVDTWMYPRLFRMNTSTGAPPDAFDANGQNWGFPTYNWEHMAEDDYAWWRSRMHHLERYFSAIRIDHILGFFRIWELPASARTGRMGRFRPSLPITRDELLARGMWDIDRLTEPFLHWQELEAEFQDRIQEIAFRFMVEHDPQRGLWRFRPEFRTEEAIFEATTPRAGAHKDFVGEQLQIRASLMKFFQNRILLIDSENIDAFYPRFGLEETSSFQALDDWMRDNLRDLSNDYYFGRQSSTWRKQARKVLPALLRSSNMLVCGEDLGFTPTCVPSVMAELGILGLRIQRMPPVGESAEFGRPQTYSYLTVCSPSCHDTMTTRAWWEQDQERRKRYDEMFGVGSDDTCSPKVMRGILTQHVDSPSVLAIFPIQDLLALDAEYAKRPALEETINDPTNPKHYWRFRLHVLCEDLLANASFVQEVRSIIGKRAHSV